MSLFEFCPHCSAPLIEATLQSELRSMCSKQCGFIHYDNPTPVVACVQTPRHFFSRGRFHSGFSPALPFLMS